MDLVKRAPKADSFVETPDGAGTVTNVNLLRETVQVRLDNDPETARYYHNTELNVVRSGKGRRPDDYVEPPLEELAKLRKPTEEDEVPVIREEGSSLGAAIQAVFEREETAPAAAAGEPQEVKPRRRRGARSRKPTQPAQPVSRPEKGEQGEKAEKGGEHTLTIRPKKPAAPKQDKPKVQVQPKAAVHADGAQKAEGGANKKPFHRRRRRSGGGKPQGGEK